MSDKLNQLIELLKLEKIDEQPILDVYRIHKNKINDNTLLVTKTETIRSAKDNTTYSYVYDTEKKSFEETTGRAVFLPFY